MTTEVTQFDVAFDKLSFKRNQNNLEVISGGNILTTYENFFNGSSIGTVQTIETKDSASGYTEHTLLTEAMIEVDGYAEYQGYNVVDGMNISGYNEKITVKYDGQTHAPVGQDEGYYSVVYGNYGDDIVLGSTKSDWLQGSQGNDIIYGGSGGEDMLSGDMGDDIVVAGSISSSGKITYNKTGIQIYGADGNDNLTGGSGDDFIWGGTGNDILLGKGGANDFVFVESDFGDDIITDATQKDELRFVVNYGTSTAPSYSGYQFSDLSFDKDGNNLVITGEYTEGETTTYNTVLIKDYFKQKSSKRVDKIYALDENGIPKEYSIVNDGNIHISLDNTRSYKGGNGDETISAVNYVSTNGKTGVSITVGTGNDVITGSFYNDTIKSGSGNNTVTEYGGVNKVTLGKGNDTVTVSEYSDNTLKVGAGNNTVYLESYGNNKVTSGAGSDTIQISAGYNNVKAGNGDNIIRVLNDSINTITTGKNDDNFTIQSGNNKIKSGAGMDTFNIAGGYNTISSGNGESIVTVSGLSQNNVTGGKNVDSYTIGNGTNYINAKAGDDSFTVSGGSNILYGDSGKDTFVVTGGDNILNGGKGDDTYDFTGFANLLTTDIVEVVDTSGVNVLKLSTDYSASDVSIYVDVSLNSKNKAKLSGDWAITSRTNADNVVEGIELSGGTKSSTNINIGTASYTVNKTVLNEMAASVASWLVSNDYVSTADVFTSGNATDVTNLIAVYNTASANFFGG